MPQRKFTAEGGLHLFSGLPTALCPAQIFQVVDDNQFREKLAGCNVYVVACRQRIRIDFESIELSGDTIIGRLYVARDGWVALPFSFQLSHEHHMGELASLEVMASGEGTHVALRRGDAINLIAVHVIVAGADCDLTAEERDLHVLYVGQAIGRSRSRLAIDRLSNHAKFQRILADMHTYHPDVEVLLLLYRFDQSRTILSTGGDLNLEVAASAEEDGLHMKRLCAARIDRRARVSLAEAALINYFKPPYNDLLKKSNFASRRKLKLLEEVINHDLTGLMVEVCSHNLRSRLRSAARAPLELDPTLVEGYQRLAKNSGELAERAAKELSQMMHTHHISFPLTNPEERDTFLHGTRWIGATERQPFM
jgi:hypothetical protein